MLNIAIDESWPDKDTAEELNRRIKILLQVAPDWQERTAPVDVRLTPEEERRVMELINQPEQGSVR